jgi:mono/diheme cytochrome c family protein
MPVQRLRQRRRLPATASAARIAAAIVSLLAVPALVMQAQDAGERTTIAGVYSNEQADRGRTLFEVKCQSCHGDALEGGTLAPALKGREFLAAFQRKPLRRIYSRIISTMPPEDAGTLTEAESLALVALVLRANGYRAGDAALTRADDLNAIVVEMPPAEQQQASWNAETAENSGLQSLSRRAPGALRSRSVR